MKDLVLIQKKTIITDSLTVAENFGKQHKHVLEKIENLLKDDDEGRLNFRLSSYINSQNKEQKKYTMGRRSFSILCMSFTGKKALKWKHRFFDAFEAMERQLLNQQNSSWLDTRSSGKGVRLDFTDSIKKVVDFAGQSGSKNPGRYYSTFTKMVYGLLFDLKKVPKDFRDTLNEETLKQLQLIEWKASQWIDDAVIGSEDYHAPYYEVKAKIQTLIEVIGNIKIHKELAV